MVQATCDIVSRHYPLPDNGCHDETIETERERLWQDIQSILSPLVTHYPKDVMTLGIKYVGTFSFDDVHTADAQFAEWVNISKQGTGLASGEAVLLLKDGEIIQEYAPEREEWDNLAEHLAERSKDICHSNRCTEEEHKCESYAYVLRDGTLLDVCYPDFFQGTSKPVAAVCMPWTGTGEELQNEVEEQTWEESEGEN